VGDALMLLPWDWLVLSFPLSFLLSVLLPFFFFKPTPLCFFFSLLFCSDGLLGLLCMGDDDRAVRD
jgi:hypothetical protein